MRRLTSDDVNREIGREEGVTIEEIKGTGETEEE